MATKKKATKKKASRYKDAEAKKYGLGPTEDRHGFSRNPYTNLLLKKPGHQTLNKSVAADKTPKKNKKGEVVWKGGRTIQVGRGLASYEKDDPRGRAGSVAAPRDRDISGATIESEVLSAINRGDAPRTAVRRVVRARKKK